MTQSRPDEALKSDVQTYWNQQPCGTQFSKSDRLTRKYFDEIEEYRYAVEPEIFAFAQFTRYHGRRVLEVGVGAGTDFLQWARSGAQATGIDATVQGIDHTRRRLEEYGFPQSDLMQADCENLPFASNTFDLVYSWGVIHHTPDTGKALQEIVRVCKPGGEAKVMVYHRRSLLVAFFWVRYALLAGRPWRSPSWCLFHRMESIGTKAYTRDEVKQLLVNLPVADVRIETKLTYYDRMGRQGRILRTIGRFLSRLLGDRFGWFLTLNFRKQDVLRTSTA